jgi:hypothetical protein
VAITIVNQSEGAISYHVFAGSASGTASGATTSGNGSGVQPSGGAVSGYAVSGNPAYTVAFGWQSFPVQASPPVEGADPGASGPA